MATVPPTGDFLIRGANVITQDPKVQGGLVDVLIKDGKIEAVGGDLTSANAHIIDANGMALIPGFVDTHRHLWSSLFRFIAGFASTVTFRKNFVAPSPASYRRQFADLPND